MINLLQNQYSLIKGSREAVLNFVETKVGPDLNQPVPAFDGNAIRYLLVHNANTYLQWLGYFAMKMPFDLFDDKDFTTIGLIRPLYEQVDETMAVFLSTFDGKPDIPVKGTLSRNREVSATPLQLFTHVITHEFHHKGQIMSMCRLLGHTPPDTDVIRF